MQIFVAFRSAKLPHSNAERKGTLTHRFWVFHQVNDTFLRLPAGVSERTDQLSSEIVASQRAVGIQAYDRQSCLRDVRSVLLET